MFDLDRSISEWRSEIAAAGITCPDTLDELESHMRDEVESQIRAGTAGEAAFTAAVQRLGQGGALNSEFKKLDGGGSRLRQKRFGIAVAALGLGLTAFGGLRFWLILKVALAVATLVPGSAGVGQRELTSSFLIFCAGLALLLLSGIYFAIGRQKRTESGGTRGIAP